MGKALITFAALLLTGFLPAGAQLTLDECRRMARENYPLIERYGLIRQTTDFTLSNIGKGWLPQLSFSGQASYQSDVMNLPDMLQELLRNNGYDYRGVSKSQYKMALDLNQPVYDGGSIRAQKKAAQAESEVKRQQTDVDMYALHERIDNLYFGLLLLEHKLRLNEELRQLLSANCAKLEAMHKHGTAMQADVDAIRAELLNARQQHTELCSAQSSFQGVLALFIGKEITDSLTMPHATLPDSYENHRPELQLFDARISQIGAHEKMLDAAIRPRISIFAQGWYGYPGLDMFSDMFSRDLTLNGLIGVRLSWNIGALYTRHNDRRNLETAVSEVENAREVFLFNNRMQQVQQTADIEKYRHLMLEDDELIGLRTSVRKAAEAKLEHGTINVSDLLRDITHENQARINKSVHKIEMQKAIYEMKNTINQ